MDIVKVTTSGQISIPRNVRNRFKTKFFYCRQTINGILFTPVEEKDMKKKYTISDMKKFVFKDNDPDKDWSSKIDQIVYEL